MTYEGLIQQLSQLEINRQYSYLPSATSSSQNTYTLLSVSESEIKVLRDDKETLVSINQAKKILDVLKEAEPLDVESTLGGSGNTRSIVESLLCLTTSIFFTRIHNRKHIVLLSSKVHPLGSLEFINESELDEIIKREKEQNRKKVEEEFKYYLTNIARSKKTGEKLKPSSISSYLIFIKCDKLFDYNPTKWKQIESIYDISSLDEINRILNTLLKDPEFVKHNKNDNNGFRSRALKQYQDFLISKATSVNKDEFDDEEETSAVGDYMFMQAIFFGAPGTGKSHKIDYNLFKDKDRNPIGKGIKEISEDRKFRTTFHPDYDYAQFVGAYKPRKVQNIDDGSLSEEQLAKKLSEFFSDNEESDKTSAIVLFGLRYANSLNGKTISEIVKHSGIGEEQYKKANLSAAVKAQLQFSKDDGTITYSFVPQVFAKAYAAAWKQYFAAGNVSTADNQVYLVIEEINRGNCAQIFGDIFQLLDRDSEGFSQYSIDADCDFAEWLKKDSILKTVWSDYETKVGNGKLKLPPNLNILATMNTSDQSLFPMDSAFKRRFDWEYVPIKYAKDSDCGEDWNADKFAIDVSGSTYMWLDFLKKVNVDIDETTHSEDKQMGEFFIKPKRDDLKISFDEFRSKVLFYLWDSVYKDETERQAVFHFPYGDGDDKIKSVTFQSLFGKDAEAIVNKIMENLKVEKVTA